MVWQATNIDKKKLELAWIFLIFFFDQVELISSHPSVYFGIEPQRRRRRGFGPAQFRGLPVVISDQAPDVVVLILQS